VQIRAPNGLACTHRFATQSVDLPAQEGERVTVALAAPSNVGRIIGPFRLSTRTPRRRPGEPMCITNHVTGLEFQLLQAPSKYGNSASFDTALAVPAVALLASGDAATAFIDPTLPTLILSVAATAIVLGTAMNTLVLPQLNQVFIFLFLCFFNLCMSGDIFGQCFFIQFIYICREFTKNISLIFLVET
jgi:hypothetical protein